MRRDNTVLVEALMELLLLSRSRVIAGQMLGNMPRLALQLRVRPPGISWYVSLDGNEWCTTSSCKSQYWTQGAYHPPSKRGAKPKAPPGGIHGTRARVTSRDGGSIEAG